jgi:hypothetical protein
MSPYFRVFAAVLLFAIAGFAAGNAFAADVRLNWTAPAACADGSPISACAVTGYEIQRAPAASEPFVVVRGVGVTTTATLTAVAPGTHCYRLRANSAAGFGEPSNVACVTVEAPKPGAPTNVTVTVTVTVQ